MTSKRCQEFQNADERGRDPLKSGSWTNLNKLCTNILEQMMLTTIFAPGIPAHESNTLGRPFAQETDFVKPYARRNGYEPTRVSQIGHLRPCESPVHDA